MQFLTVEFICFSLFFGSLKDNRKHRPLGGAGFSPVSKALSPNFIVHHIRSTPEFGAKNTVPADFTGFQVHADRLKVHPLEGVEPLSQISLSQYNFLAKTAGNFVISVDHISRWDLKPVERICAA